MGGMKTVARELGQLAFAIGPTITILALIYQLIGSVPIVNEHWGWAGAVAYLILPLWFGAPFIVWLLTGEPPEALLVAWVAMVIVGPMILAVGSFMRQIGESEG